MEQTLEAFITLCAGFLVIKMPVLWSESRVLRKLQALTSQQLSLITSATDEIHIFAQMYTHLAKGRHRRVGRMYKSLFYLFMLGLDVSLDYQGVALMSSGIFALRAVLYFGMFSVWGARPFSLTEAVSLVALVAFQLCITGLFLVGVIANGDSAAQLAFVIRILRGIVSVLSACFHVYEFFTSFRGTGTHVSDISNAICKNRLKDESRQECRLHYMLVMCEEAEKQGKGTKSGPYWCLSSAQIADITSLAFVFLTNGIAWGRAPISEVPPVLLIEALEIISAVLSFVNDTQVESTLFARLLIASRGLAADERVPECCQGTHCNTYVRAINRPLESEYDSFTTTESCQDEL